MDKDTNKKTNKKKKKINWFKAITLILGTLILVSGIGIAFVTLGVIKTAEPYDFTKIEEMLDESSFIFDENGVLIEKISNGEYSTIVSIDRIPQDLKDAVVAIEDERFYDHNGIDVRRVFGAMWSNIKTMSLSQGASTLTMQVSKNLYTSMDKTWTRKIKDAYYALEMEKVLSKDQILHAYLNTMGMGRGTRGVAAAAHVYFNKDVSELTLAESAMLAGVTKYPYKYSPYMTARIEPGDDYTDMQISLIASNEETPAPTEEDIKIFDALKKNGLISNSEYDQLKSGEYYVRKAILNPDSKERQELVLSQMLKLEYITEEEYQAAVAEPIKIRLGKKGEAAFSSYFGDKVKIETVKALMSVGFSEEDANDILYNGGLRIYSTMDSRIQKAVEEEVNNPSNFPGSRVDENGIPQPQTAAVIMDQYTGEVKALVGGRGISGSKIYNRALNPRQPGSSIKPLAVYLPALENGLTAASGFVDEPIKNEKGEYWPKNYSTYDGPTTLRDLVVKSSNVGAVQVAEKIGIGTVIKSLKDLGISTVVTRSENSKTNDENFSVTLGGMTRGATPLDLTAAYATIANNGEYIKPSFIGRIETAGGTVLYQNTPESRKVASPQSSYIMTDIMKDVVNRGTGGAAKVKNFVTAGKTGTTNDEKDIWFAGYTPHYTAAVWIGEDIPKDLNKTSDVVSRLWGKIMNKVHVGLPNKSFTMPSGIVGMGICSESGLLVSEQCTKTRKEIFVQGTTPTKTCDIHEFVAEEDDSLLGDDIIENEDNNEITPPVTEPPITEPPVTEPPVTEIPVTPPTDNTEGETDGGSDGLFDN